MGLLFGRGRSRSIFRHIPLIRWVGPLVTLAGTGVSGFLALTGRIDISAIDLYRGTQAAVHAEPVRLEQLGAKSAETIRVATFNIQVFGEKKSSDAEVMGILAQILSRFDVIAIQEIRAKTALPVERLVELINRSGGRYRAVTSDPIGRTVSKEAYAFVWDEQHVTLEANSAYVIGDEADRMHREPMVASFRALAAPRDGRLPFRFTIINVHTDPDEVSDRAPNNELNVLDDVFSRVREYEYQVNGETDYLLVGDLNVDVSHLGELGMIPNVVSVVGDIPTNTARTKTYDHILLDRTMTQEFTGNSGVFDVEKVFGLSRDQAQDVSDHLPVWAEFSAYEVTNYAPANTAVAPPSTARR